jgi:hypothetical protein
MVKWSYIRSDFTDRKKPILLQCQRLYTVCKPYLTNMFPPEIRYLNAPEFKIETQAKPKPNPSQIQAILQPSLIFKFSKKDFSHVTCSL